MTMHTTIKRRLELPPSKDVRWNIKRKDQVVAAVESRYLTKNEALDIYGLTDQEYSKWLHSYRSRHSAPLEQARH